MVINLYAQLANVKADLNIASTTTSYDSILLRLIEDVSRSADALTRRTFYASSMTRVYDVERTRYWDGGYAFGGAQEREFWPTDDICSITSVKVDTDGDLVYETTLALNTDYLPWPSTQDPANPSPYRRIDLNPLSTLLQAWPYGRNRVQIVGLFGYSNEVEDTGQTVADNPLTAGATTLTMGSTATISVGETIELESEQVYVSAVASATTLTIIRAQNGTAAASHANGVTVYRRRYNRLIERAVTMQVCRLYKRRETGFANTIANTDLGTYTIFRGLDPDVQAMLGQFVEVAAGVA